MKIFYTVSFFLIFSLTTFSAASPFSLSDLETFYDEFLCDEKSVLSEAGLSPPCPLCGSIPAPSNTGDDAPDPILSSPDVWSFVSEPNLHPMKIQVNVLNSGLSPGFIFVAPYAFSAHPTYGETGSLIIDNLGNPIYFRSLSSPNLGCDKLNITLLKSHCFS